MAWQFVALHTPPSLLALSVWSTDPAPAGVGRLRTGHQDSEQYSNVMKGLEVVGERRSDQYQGST